MIDCKNERKVEMAQMIEPKYKHRITNCNGKVYVLGGYQDENGMKSHSVFKYDADLKRWFSCNSIRYGRADFTCLSSMYSSNIYVFGGADGEE